MLRVIRVAALLVLPLALAFPASADEAEQKAVALIEELGGVVIRDEVADGKPIVGIDLGETGTNDGHLDAIVAALPKLRALFLPRTQVTNAGMAKVKTMKELVLLDVGDTPVTDAGLKDLPEGLEALHLGGAKVGNEGMKEVGRLKKLKRLHLERTQVGDDGLKALKELKDLRGLFLAGCKITDDGLKELAGMESLRQLDLSVAELTDAGVTNIKPLKELRILRLMRSGVTDLCVKDLREFRKLELVNLNQAKMTNKGFDELQKVLPDCDIRR
jgi:hypothetical protein